MLAVYLLAARFGVPCCPHAGGVGLSEYVQHLALADYVAISGDLTERVVEYVDELHEHFVAPARMRDGRYVVPEAPGYSVEMRRESVAYHAFPHGAVWGRDGGALAVLRSGAGERHRGSRARTGRGGGPRPGRAGPPGAARGVGAEGGRGGRFAHPPRYAPAEIATKDPPRPGRGPAPHPFPAKPARAGGGAAGGAERRGQGHCHPYRFTGDMSG